MGKNADNLPCIVGARKEAGIEKDVLAPGDEGV